MGIYDSDICGIFIYPTTLYCVVRFEGSHLLICSMTPQNKFMWIRGIRELIN